MAKAIETLRNGVESSAIRIDEGLRALHEVATHHHAGISGATISVLVEQITESLGAEVRKLYALADATPRAKETVA